MDSRTIYLFLRDIVTNPWIIYGVLIVGGVFILVRVLDSFFRSR
ncbi:MAG: hypothetical protein ACRD4U_04175 [Candidatus Acidiferrales bacterium]